MAKRPTTRKAAVTDSVRRVMPTADGLRNVLSGMGGSSDKMMGASFVVSEMSQQQLDAAYRSDWITRKGVDIPAFDATREWRAWQADNDQITAIEGTEKKFFLQQKTMRTLQCARLYGGAALVIGVDDGSKSEEPLNLDAVDKDSLKFVHSVSRNEITAGAIDRNIESPYYGEPTYYDQVSDKGSVRLHPSRVVRFVGSPILDVNQANGWGDSILMAVMDAVLGAGTVTGSVAQLVSETKLDVIKIPGLSENITVQEYEENLRKRFEIANVAKSVYRILLLDGAEEWERIESNFNGLPDIQKLFLLIASGAFDVPATRFLGQSPAGLTATGDSDIRNYYDRCSTNQKMEIQPTLKRLDDVLIRSSLGQMSVEEADKIFYNWNPLWQLTDAEKVTVWKGKADIAKIDFDMGLINEVVLKKARENQLIEDGVYPGFESILDEFDDDPNLENQPAPPPPPTIDPATGLPVAAKIDPKTGLPVAAKVDPKGTQPAFSKSNAVAADAMAKRIRDASSTPRSLYVRRDVLNSNDIKAWAKEQGFETSLDDMHVTIIYSKEAVDWLKIGANDWGSDSDGNLTVKAGGPRVIEKFGEGAIVLAFSSSDLQYRNMSARENGASWDFEDYTPHITITYKPPLGLDVSAVKPYSGVIALGPEIFEEIKNSFSPSEVTES